MLLRLNTQSELALRLKRTGRVPISNEPPQFGLCEPGIASVVRTYLPRRCVADVIAALGAVHGVANMTLWKHCLALTLFAALAGTSGCALAQGTAQQPEVPAYVPASEPSVAPGAQAPMQPPPPPPSAPTAPATTSAPPPPPTAPAAAPSTRPVNESVVQWTLEVLRDGQQIDSFDGTTTVGQARTDTHHKVVAHNVGCKDQPAGSIDLSRTITVSPLQVRANLIILSIDAQETLEGDTAPSTPEGCKLPPQPRQVNANHPGLVVPDGQWVNWQIVDQNPSLMYRVRATLAPQAAQ